MEIEIMHYETLIRRHLIVQDKANMGRKKKIMGKAMQLEQTETYTYLEAELSPTRIT